MAMLYWTPVKHVELCIRGHRPACSRRGLPIDVAVLVGLVALASACAGEGNEASPTEAAESPGSVQPPGEDATPEEPGDAPAQVLNGPIWPAPGTYRGTYFVPVTDELAAYALFEIDEIEIRLQGGELELRYDLPALLLGDSFGLSFRGAVSSAPGVTLLGDHGSATCSAVDSVWRCDEMLRDLSPDLNKIEEELSQMSAPEAEARRGVAEVFAVDPIGVLSFDMTP